MSNGKGLVARFMEKLFSGTSPILLRLLELIVQSFPYDELFQLLLAKEQFRHELYLYCVATASRINLIGDDYVTEAHALLGKASAKIGDFRTAIPALLAAITETDRQNDSQSGLLFILQCFVADPSIVLSLSSLTKIDQYILYDEINLSQFLSLDPCSFSDDTIYECLSALQLSVRKYLLHMKVKKAQYLLLDLNRPFHSSGAKYQDANELELLIEMGSVVAYARGRYAQGPGDNRHTTTILDSTNRYMKANHFDSTKFSVISDASKGGFSIIAQRDLLAGETLFTESCICCVAGDIDRPNRCHHCSVYIDHEYLKCQCVCGEVYCSEECLEVAKLQYHDALCCRDYRNNINFLSLPGQTVTYQKVIYAVIKLIGMTLMKETRLCNKKQHFSPLNLPLFRHLSSCVDVQSVPEDMYGFVMSEALMPHQVTLKLHNLLSQQLGHLYTDNPYFTIENMAYMMSMIKNNAFEGGHDCSALFFLASFFNHSCAPNIANELQNVPGEGAVITLSTKRAVQAGEELCITYVASKGRTETQRRAVLKEGYGFDCTCSLCSRDNRSEV